MSYDISIVYRDYDGETVRFDKRHNFRQGTYPIGGSDRAKLNITYNYAPIFRRVLELENGIWDFDGMDIYDTIPILEKAIAALGDAEPSEDYWEATDGNAKQALQQLLDLALMAESAHPTDSMEWQVV